MEVKPGYKQTEVGVIPEDWDVCTLRRVRAIMSGRHSSHATLGTKRDHCHRDQDIQIAADFKFDTSDDAT